VEVAGTDIYAKFKTILIQKLITYETIPYIFST